MRYNGGMKENWTEWETLETVPSPEGAEEEIVSGDITPDAAADCETLPEVRHTGEEEILSIEEEQQMGLHRELLLYKRALADLDVRLRALEAEVKRLKGE